MFEYDDGGREAAGFKGTTGDCATRAIAIATGRPYREVYDSINAIGKAHRSNARKGVYRETMDAYFAGIGWRWVPTMKVGAGCTTHLRADELPSGPIVARCSRHYVAVIDGVVRDTFDSSRNGTRCVYGYWAP
jgi:hypothetical protein